MLWKLHKRLVFPKCYFISMFIDISFYEFVHAVVSIYFLIVWELVNNVFWLYSLSSFNTPWSKPASLVTKIDFLVIVLLFLPSKPNHATLIFLVVWFRWSMVNLPEALFFEQVLSLFQHLVPNFPLHDGILSGLNLHRDSSMLSQPLWVHMYNCPTLSRKQYFVLVICHLDISCSNHLLWQ